MNRKNENLKSDSFYKKIKLNFSLAKTMLIAWILMFIVAAFAFAGFTTKLTSEAEATIQKHIYDYVYIEHVSISSSSNGSNMYYSFEDHEIKPTTNISSCDGYVEYALDIVNTTPYKAFITTTQVKSMINGSGSNTSSMSVEFIDVEANTTYIEPHSTKTIHVRVKNNCTGSDSQVTSTINFEYSLYKYFDLTVVADQTDAAVSMTTTEGTFTGTGTVTHRVAEGETATYTATKKYYYDYNGSYTMETLDHTVNFNMIPDPRRTLVVNVTMTDDSSRTRVYNQTEGTPTLAVTQDGIALSPKSGDNTFTIEMGKSVNVSVIEPEYYYTSSGSTYNDYSNTFTVTGETTLNVELKEKPYITGIIQNTNRTTAATQTLTNYHTGYYLIEAWGGRGGKGNDDKDGGTSGHVYGYVYLTNNTATFATAGGNGADNAGKSAAGGANGGGAGGSDNSDQGGGGGYSAFIRNITSITTSDISNGNALLIAAGGGGGGGNTYLSNTAQAGFGGDGGTLSTTSTSITGGTVFSGTDGTSSGSSLFGTGSKGAGGAGKTSAGQINGSGSNGSFMAGGAGGQRGGGGGAGYYGGAGGSGSRTPLTSYDYGPGGGGGGSSFVSSQVTYSNLPTSISQYLLGSNPSTTGGTVVITFIGKTL